MGKPDASVTFARTDGIIEMILRIDGEEVFRSASQESIARELQIYGAKQLTIEDKFSTELPTSSKTLSEAASVPFSELMAALKLLAACASSGEPSAMPFPERRAKPRVEKFLGEHASQSGWGRPDTGKVSL